MTRDQLRMHLRHLLVVGVLAAAGIAAAIYVLIEERAPLPFQSTYQVHAIVTAANGIQPGLGQPVRVAGVDVGTVSGLSLNGDGGVITLRIQRSELPHMYTNATVALQPITPLYDMEVDLNPGTKAARLLPAGGTIPVGQTSSPVQLTDILSSSLDADSRAFLSSLISSLYRGTNGRSADMRGALLAMGPTVHQLHAVSAALAGRDQALRRLVHNIAVVTKAATADRQLAPFVASAQRALLPLAQEDVQLGQAIRQLPPTMAQTDSTLGEVRTFATELKPALSSLLPAVHGLTPALGQLGNFAGVARTEIAGGVRPFVNAAVPALNRLAPAVHQLNGGETPDVLTNLKGLNYFLNELAYSPKDKRLGKPDEGGLFWMPWFLHNYNSVFSAKDANGGIARGMVMVDCQQLLGLSGLEDVFRLLLPTYALCPAK
jgi:phospholipid/cholesterol/gamma-HCH transport system substrate-binding protein